MKPKVAIWSSVLTACRFNAQYKIQKEIPMPFIGSKITVPVSAKKKEAIKNELGIPGDKVYVEYRGTYNWGWNGSNF